MPRGVIDLEALKSAREVASRRICRTAGLPFDIKRLGHLVLKVRDLWRSAEFYTAVLGFEVSDVYPESMMAGGMVFLRVNTDHHCLALVGGALNDSPNREVHHVAFEVATLDEVVRARDHLRQRNVKIEFDGRRRAGCQIAVEFRDPDNHIIEIYWGLDQIGSDGRVRAPEEWREALSLEQAIANPPRGQDVTLHDEALRRRLDMKR